MATRNAESMGSYGSTWTANGYSGCGNVAELLGSLRGGPAVVVGSAEGVFDELGKVLAKMPEAAIFAVNDVGMFLPDVDHWVSLHADNLGAWKNVRWLQSRGREPKYHLPDKRPVADYAWERLTPLYALSGYFAMQIAFLMGADQIVLCGCPGNAARRFFEGKPRADFAYGADAQGSGKGVREQIEREMARLPGFKARVRSTSGWTASYFGQF